MYEQDVCIHTARLALVQWQRVALGLVGCGFNPLLGLKDLRNGPWCRRSTAAAHQVSQGTMGQMQKLISYPSGCDIQ